MKTLKFAFVTAVMMAALVPAQAEGLSYSVGVFSSNTDDIRSANTTRPSLALGAGYDMGNGLGLSAGYVTGQYEGQTKANGEVTLALSFEKELSNGVMYDLTASRYMYSGGGGASNDLALTVGYGQASLTYTKDFNESGFINPHKLDFTLSHNLTDQISAGVTLTSQKGSADTYEIFAGYDLGNNLELSASIYKDKPRFVLGVTKSF